MRYLCLLLLVLFPIKSFCQRRDFIYNVKAEDTLVQENLTPIIKDYDFSIAYSTESYWWISRKDFYILASRANRWYLITYKKHYQKDTSGQYYYDTVTAPTISFSRQRVSNKNIKKLFSVLDAQRFWSMNTDSLDIDEKKNSDTSYLSMSITDGVLYRFEVNSGAKKRIVDAYEPEELLEFLPEITVRRNFIICRDAFVDLKRKYIKSQRSKVKR